MEKNSDGIEPAFWNTKKAAAYFSQFFPISPATLLEWSRTDHKKQKPAKCRVTPPPTSRLSRNLTVYPIAEFKEWVHHVLKIKQKD